MRLKEVHHILDRQFAQSPVRLTASAALSDWRGDPGPAVSVLACGVWPVKTGLDPLIQQQRNGPAPQAVSRGPAVILDMERKLAASSAGSPRSSPKKSAPETLSTWRDAAQAIRFGREFAGLVGCDGAELNTHRRGETGLGQTAPAARPGQRVGLKISPCSCLALHFDIEIDALWRLDFDLGIKLDRGQDDTFLPSG